MKKILIVLAALAPMGAAPAQAATADLRVEGTSVRIPLVHTTLPAQAGKDGQTQCDGQTGLGALDAGTAGDWDGPYYDGYGYSIARVGTETWNFGSGAFWSVFIDDHYANSICDAVTDGGEVTVFAACDSLYGSPPADLPCYGRTVTHGSGTSTVNGVLATAAPKSAAPGVPFAITVQEAHTTFDDTSGAATSELQPSEGATAGGATTDGGGHAAVTLTDRGVQQVRVTKPDFVPDTVEVCVTDGADGFCGTTKAGDPEPPPPPPCVHDGDDGRCGTPDTKPALTSIVSIKDGQAFGKGKGPRTLSGTVADDVSGTKKIRLRLVRKVGKRCWTYDPEAARFVRIGHCGARHGLWFEGGEKADWTFLLSSRLKKGTYTLDARSIDRSGNFDVARERGRNLVVFKVA